MNEGNVSSELKGNTFRVYWYLLESLHKSVGPREVQRKLNFSSPALAVYHLNKLVDLNLVKKVAGEYHLIKIVDAGVLQHFMRVGGFIVPRFVLYATMFSTLFGFFLSQVKEINFYSLFAFIFGLLGTGILWFETIRIWRSRP